MIDSLVTSPKQKDASNVSDVKWRPCSVDLLKVQVCDPDKDRDKLQHYPNRNTMDRLLRFLSLFHYL